MSDFGLIFSFLSSNFMNPCSFQTVFNYLAEAVGLIIKCDSVFQTSQLQNIWGQYVTAIIGNSQLSHNDITGFENLLSKIGYLLTGHLFQVIGKRKHIFVNVNFVFCQMSWQHLKSSAEGIPNQYFPIVQFVLIGSDHTCVEKTFQRT